jgi:hypothetical protein
MVGGEAMNQATAALLQVWAAKWQVSIGVTQCIIGILNIGAFIVLSIYIGKATEASATANKQMTDLSRETAEENKAREVRDLKAEIELALETYQATIEWLSNAQLTDLKKDILLPFPQYICNIENMPSKALDYEQLSKIKKARYTFDSITEKINNYIEVEGTKTKLSENSLKEEMYKQLINALSRRTILEEMKIFSESLNELVSMIKEVQASL